jgi:type VI secretion system protein ImpA
MNLEAILAPVADESPCGEDMSFSSEFDTLQNMRREDDPTLDQGEWVTDLKVADWPGVARLSEELLSKRSKDLRLAGWLVEAAARTRGFAGLADGLSACAQLVERYWEQVHPQADDGDQEQRIGNLSWLLSQVEALAPLMPVFKNGAKHFALRDIESARALQRSIEQQGADQVSTEGRVTNDDIAKAQREVPREFLSANLDDVARAVAALGELQRVVDERLGAEGPAFAAARRALDDAVHGMQRLARDAGLLGGDAADGSYEGEAAAAGGAPGLPTGPIQSRAQALQQLRIVADFFRRTEPHSPVAYLADKAAKWGDMPLHVWLRTVVKEQGALAHLEELLGTEPPGGEAQ